MEWTPKNQECRRVQFPDNTKGDAQLETEEIKLEDEAMNQLPEPYRPMVTHAVSMPPEVLRSNINDVEIELNKDKTNSNLLEKTKNIDSKSQVGSEQPRFRLNSLNMKKNSVEEVKKDKNSLGIEEKKSEALSKRSAIFYQREIDATRQSKV